MHIQNTALYDETEAFPFSIAHMPHRDSNLSSKTFYESIVSEILRLPRTNSEKSLFVNTTQFLLRRMYK